MFWTGIVLGFALALGVWLFLVAAKLARGFFRFTRRTIIWVFESAAFVWDKLGDFMGHFPRADKSGNPVGWN